MKTLKFKSGIVEVYETEQEMIDILSKHLGKDKMDWVLKDERFKNFFNPNANGSRYIKKVIVIKVPNEIHASLMCFEHWNYAYKWDLHKGVCQNVEINMNTYSNGLAHTTFRMPNKDLQKCFIEYYNTVRDDDVIEKILNTFKVGDKIYFKDFREHTLSSETINYIGLDCYEEFVVEVGTNEREKKFAIARINKDGSCHSYLYETVYVSLEKAKESCLEDLRELKKDYKNKIYNLEKKMVEAMAFA